MVLNEGSWQAVRGAKQDQEMHVCTRTLGKVRGGIGDERLLASGEDFSFSNKRIFVSFD